MKLRRRAVRVGDYGAAVASWEWLESVALPREAGARTQIRKKREIRTLGGPVPTRPQDQAPAYLSSSKGIPKRDQSGTSKSFHC